MQDAIKFDMQQGWSSDANFHACSTKTKFKKLCLSGDVLACRSCFLHLYQKFYLQRNLHELMRAFLWHIFQENMDSLRLQMTESGQEVLNKKRFFHEQKFPRNALRSQNICQKFIPKIPGPDCRISSSCILVCSTVRLLYRST